MPSRSGRGKSSLALSVALAAGLPVGIGAALYLAVSAASPACREHARRVVIDGTPVEAYATICRESGGWVLDGPPSEEDASVWEGKAVAEKPEAVAAKVAVERPPPPVAVEASKPVARPVRRNVTHARRVTPERHSFQHIRRARPSQWDTAVPQPKYGP